MLTTAQLAQYREEGFLALDALTTPTELEWLRSVYDDLFARRVGWAPVVLAALYFRRATGGVVMAGLVVGVIVTILFIAQPDWRPWPLRAGLFGLVANFVVLFAGMALAGRSTDESDEFLAAAEQPDAS